MPPQPEHQDLHAAQPMTDLAGNVRLVETAYGPLALRRQGSGPPVVLLHPLALSGELWSGLSDVLAADFDVLSVDLRGHGASGWDGRPSTIEEMALDVAETLNTLDVTSVSMLGMSMGGSVAAAFAGMFPERVESLVLADTTAWYGEDAVAEWAGRAERARDVPREEQIPFQVDRWFSPAFAAANPAEVDRIVRIFLDTDSGAHAAACTAMGTLDARGLLPSVRADTLVVVGEEDYATPLAMSEELAGAIPGASLVTFPGLRHMALIERPTLAGLVREQFLSGKVSEEVR